jgi:branched-chain amino acid transport system substrate-binding protein
MRWELPSKSGSWIFIFGGGTEKEPMISRRVMLTAGLAASGVGRPVRARADTPGVSATEIKIGNTMPYSGPASSYAPIGRLETAFFQMVNETGGFAGRKINFISYDDGLSPPKTVEDVRRLVEEDGVSFLFGMLGTPTNTAIADNLNRRKIPHLFLATGASKFSDYKKYPWTIGFNPNNRIEAQVYATYMRKRNPAAKIAILYQNDDLGKDYVAGVRDVFGDDFDKAVIAASYEVTDATIDSQISMLQASGANILLVAAIPKFAAQSIRKVHDINWKPLFFMSNISISVSTVLAPAGPEKAIGLISAGYLKDATDPSFAGDAGMLNWRAFMAKYMPAADLGDTSYVYSYSACNVIMQVLRQCDGDFSRENIMHQAENLYDLEIQTLLPGIKLNTRPTEHRLIKALQLQKWDGQTWVRFGDLIEGVKES